MTFIRNIITTSLEANVAGRLRVSEQQSQIGYLQAFEKDVTRFDEETNGTATSVYEANGIGGVNMTVAANLDFVVRKGKEANYYYPGSPQKIELTSSNFHNQVNVIKRMGYYSSTTITPFSTILDGFAFESDGTEHYCRIYRAGTLVWELPSSSWNRQDLVSSWIPQGFGFYVIEFLYLGGAVADFKILLNGDLITVARYSHVGVDVNTFVKSPNQPIRYEIRSTGGVGEFNHICGDVASEGNDSGITISRAVNNGTALLTSLAEGTRYALVGLRLKSTLLLSVADVYGISVISATTDRLLIELFIGGTVVAPVWADEPNTIMSFMNGANLTPANAVHSGGIRLLDFYMTGNSAREQVLENSRRLGSLIDGTPEEVFLCVTPLGANASALASINWKEFI